MVVREVCVQDFMVLLLSEKVPEIRHFFVVSENVW